MDSFCTSVSSYMRPIRRLVAYTVLLELVTACNQEHAWRAGAMFEQERTIAADGHSRPLAAAWQSPDSLHRLLCCCTAQPNLHTPPVAALRPQARTWRLAGSPTRRSPLSVKATTEGVVRWPSAFSMTLGVCGQVEG